MTSRERKEHELLWIRTKHHYAMTYFEDFNYKILEHIQYKKRAGRGSNQSYNDCVIMADTETSKKKKNEVYQNHVVAWTISIRAFEYNVVTLWGRKPSDMIRTFQQIQKHMKGHDTFIYFHNLSYDWVFLRKFLFKEYGYPDKMLATKPHYPIQIQWEDAGLILKDSLILAQRGLEKWGEDLNVQHQKAVGKWDYDQLRNQNEQFTKDELEYIEHDTLCGVECINEMMNQLHKSIYSMPYTATGIPREETRKRGKKNNARNAFMRKALDYDQQIKMELLFHGGYTHGNRACIGWTWYDVVCYDFASSYPFIMLSEKFPMERFTPIDDCKISDILAQKEEYAIYCKLKATKVTLKDYDYPMPALQVSKAVKLINPVIDNGRVLYADYIEIYVTEQDLVVIDQIYNFESHICIECESAMKDYLPRWFTDYVFELFTAKTMLKGDDSKKVEYALAKAKLNSLYGMCVQKPVKQNLKEEYETGEYWVDTEENVDLYQKYLDNVNTILPFQWGVWVTAYAFRNLFKMGSCAGTWIYSDTDSCYGCDWDQEALSRYNQSCKDRLTANGYSYVYHNDLEYWLGVAELDGDYTEYRVLGAKRYACRDRKSGKLKITVAGVPKSGAECLHDDIENFRKGLIFSGSVTGKKTHTHIFVPEIYIDENGCETGDSVDLSQCDYLLDDIIVHDIDELLEKEEAFDGEAIYNTELLLQYRD